MLFRLRYKKSKRKQFEENLEIVGSNEEKAFYEAIKNMRKRSFKWAVVITVTVWLLSSIEMFNTIRHAQVKTTPLAAFIYPTVIQVSSITFLFMLAGTFIPMRVLMGKNKDIIDRINQKVCEHQEDLVESLLESNHDIDLEQEECEVAFVYLGEWANIGYLEYELE